MFAKKRRNGGGEPTGVAGHLCILIRGKKREDELKRDKYSGEGRDRERVVYIKTQRKRTAVIQEFDLPFVMPAFVLLPVVPVGNGKFAVRGVFVGRDELVLREEFEGRGGPSPLPAEVVVVGSDGFVSFVGVVGSGESAVLVGVVGSGLSGLLGGIAGPGTLVLLGGFVGTGTSVLPGGVMGLGESGVLLGITGPVRPGGTLVLVDWPVMGGGVKVGGEAEGCIGEGKDAVGEGGGRVGVVGSARFSNF